MATRKGELKGSRFGKSLRKIIAWTLAAKAAVLVLIVLGYFFFPFQDQNFRANYRFPVDQPVNLSTHFKTWDAQFYLSLAEQGYAPYQARNAFYPLFPFLIRVTSFLFFGNTLLAGLALSTLFAAAAMAYLFLLVREKYGEKPAVWTCLFMISFPMAFFCGLVYTESLFLMLSVMLFYYFRKGNIAAAVLCAFLLPLTRPTGILVVLPALVECFRQSGDGKNRPEWGRLAVPAGFALGFAAYLGLMRFSTGNAFGGFEAQKVFVMNHSVAYFLRPWQWVQDNFLHGDFSLNDLQTGFMNKALFLAALGIAVLSFKRLDRTFWVYLVAIGILPALSGYLTSYARFASVVFPFFIFLGLALKKHPEYFLWLCLLLQALFVLMHSLNHYVA